MKNKWIGISEIVSSKRYRRFRESMTAGLSFLLVLYMTKESFVSFVKWASIACFSVSIVCVIIDMGCDFKAGKKMNNGSLIIVLVLLATILFEIFIDKIFP